MNNKLTPKQENAAKSYYDQLKVISLNTFEHSRAYADVSKEYETENPGIEVYHIDLTNVTAGTDGGVSYVFHVIPYLDE